MGKDLICQILAFPYKGVRDYSVCSEYVGQSAAVLMVRNKEYGNEGVLPEPNGVLCGLCRIKIAQQDLIIAGHTVNICSECFTSLNSSDLEQLAYGKN